MIAGRCLDHRRGAVIVALVLVMLLVGLVIVGAVLGGARDQDMTTQRVQTLHSIYAAESGINMAVREMVLHVDSDADGTIGTISDDGNGANNPALNGASWYVTSSTAGVVTTLTSTSSLGSTRRSVDSVITGSVDAGGPTGLIGYWKLDDASGSTVSDSYASYDGTAYTTTWSTGPWGGALKSSGLTSHVDIANASVFQLTSALTVCGWVKCTAGSSWPTADVVFPIMRKGEANPNNWQLSICNAKIEMALDDSDNSGITGDSTLSTGRWYHVAGSWDGSTVSLYLNGTLDNSPPDSRTGTIGTDTRLVHIGGRDTTDSSNASVDDVRLYGRALTQAEIQQIMSGTRHMIYGDNATNIPKVRDWDTSSWDTLESTLNVGGSERWIVAKNSAKRRQTIVAVGDSSSNLNCMIYDGATWSNLNEVTTALGTITERPFYVAIEQLSGDALVIYRAASSANIYYSTWNGTTWSSASSTATSGAGSPTFIKAVSKPESDEILVLIIDSSSDASAMIWNGSSFGNEVLLDNSTNGSTVECGDVAYESTSGDGLVCWGRNGTSVPYYRAWSASAWGAVTAMPTVGGNIKWLRLTSDPVSNKIIAGTLDASSDINVCVWSGGSWGSVSEFDTDTGDSDRRNFDVAFEAAGTRALIMYTHTAIVTPYYRTYDGTNWSGQSAGPNVTNMPSWIQLTPAKGGREIMVGLERKTDGSLCFMRWTGSAMADNQVIVSDLGGTGTNECYMMTESLEGMPAIPAVTGWAEVSP